MFLKNNKILGIYYNGRQVTIIYYNGQVVYTNIQEEGYPNNTLIDCNEKVFKTADDKYFIVYSGNSDEINNTIETSLGNTLYTSNNNIVVTKD